MRIEISSALILMLLISTVSGFCSSDTNKAKYSNDATRIITIPRLAAAMTTNGAMQDSQGKCDPPLFILVSAVCLCQQIKPSHIRRDTEKKENRCTIGRFSLTAFRVSTEEATRKVS